MVAVFHLPGGVRLPWPAFARNSALHPFGPQSLISLRISSTKMDLPNDPGKEDKNKWNQPYSVVNGVPENRDPLMDCGHHPGNSMPWADSAFQGGQDFNTSYHVYGNLPFSNQGNLTSYTHQQAYDTYPSDAHNGGFLAETSASAGSVQPGFSQGSSLSYPLRPKETKYVLKSFHCPRCQESISPGEILLSMGSLSCVHDDASASSDVQQRTSLPRQTSYHPDLADGSFILSNEAPPLDPYAKGPENFGQWTTMSDSTKPTLPVGQRMTGWSSTLDHAFATRATPDASETSVMGTSYSYSTDLKDQATGDPPLTGDINGSHRKRKRAASEGSHKDGKDSSNYKSLFTCALGECKQTFTLEKDMRRHQRHSLIHKEDRMTSFEAPLILFFPNTRTVRSTLAHRDDNCDLSLGPTRTLNQETSSSERLFEIRMSTCISTHDEK
ncbi:hypothetical protein BJ170DRAFT_730458 [Xylariales sp. AK1849]|nr:hypothetical protein BJ170DRAFT_730458 [Xylariales sp. AK1849]